MQADAERVLAMQKKKHAEQVPSSPIWSMNIWL
jgi:hypothetical protein